MGDHGDHGHHKIDLPNEVGEFAYVRPVVHVAAIDENATMTMEVIARKKEDDMPEKDPTNGTTKNRKWKLIVGMELLYALLYALLFVALDSLVRHGHITEEVFKSLVSSGMTVWTTGAIGLASWYMGVNVTQKIWGPGLDGAK